MSFATKVKRKLKNGSWYPFYNSFYEKCSLDPHMILLESRSGRALESNILSILKELCKDSYHQYKLVLSVHKSSENEIREKLKKNSIHGVYFVHTGSVSYYKALSRAGYLVNDTSFPGRFIKKEGQIYLNTWHGTPLKKMGRDNQPEKVTMGNVLRNLLDSDYLVFPNEFMEEKMSGAYMLDTLYRGTVIREGYPRNDIFRQSPNTTIKKNAGFAEKKLITYFPTYRGIFNQVELRQYLDKLSKDLTLWDSQLSDDELLLVKLHPFLHGHEDFDHYKHIRSFPVDWDTYEGLSQCDTLITDYSSVFYDYANAGKKIVFYAYDRTEYESTRGMYENLEKYPFHYTEKASEVIPLIHDDGGMPDDEFMQRYATYEDGHGTEKICRFVFLGENCCRLHKYNGNGKENILMYGGDLNQNGITTALFSMLKNLDLDKYNYFISFRMLSLQSHPERLKQIPDCIGIYPLASEMNMDVITGFSLYLKMHGRENHSINSRIHTAYRREWKKHFGATEFASMIHYNGYEAYITSTIQEAPCTRIIWVHNDMADEIRTKGNQNLYLLREAYNSYDHIVAVSRDIYDATVSGIGADSAKVVVINNCHDYKHVIEQSQKHIAFQDDTKSSVTLDKLVSVVDSNDDKFISIGRYSPEKGHYRLIDAFNTYWKDHTNTWLILIGGTGELYTETSEYAAASPAADHIITILSMQNPMPVLKKCNLFILSSFYEGRPIVLMEAATLGIPMMACDVNGCHGFMTEYNGTLLDNSTEGLTEGMNTYHDGGIHPVNVDFDIINKTAADKIEKLFSDRR